MQRFQAVLTTLLFVSLLLPAALSPAAAQDTQASTPDDRPIKIIAFGDSLTQGYGVGPGEAFPEQLQKALRDKGYDVEVANAGVSGDTTTGGLARLEWSVPEDADLVIVELGANDALRGIPTDITRSNLDQIIQKLKARGQDLLLAGMLAPPNMGADYANAFNKIFPELAQKNDVPLYPFFLEGVADDPQFNQADAMHPNRKGVAIIVDNMMPVITKELDAIKAG